MSNIVPAHIVNNPFPGRLVYDLQDEIVRQDQKWGPIEGATPAGTTRLALALIRDELEEAEDAWIGERSSREMRKTRAEVLQVAALAVRALRDAF